MMGGSCFVPLSSSPARWISIFVLLYWTSVETTLALAPLLLLNQRPLFSVNKHHRHNTGRIPGQHKDDDYDAAMIASSMLQGGEDVAAMDSARLLAELATRQEALRQGIGKRYICRTQKGWLNIHEQPGDPYDTENIVGQLSQDQIVTSTGPNQEDWIQHDGGGWSISKYGGFTWLELLDD